MALNLNEEATLTLKAQTGQFNTDMKALDDRSKELLKTLKEIEKTGPGKKSEEWRAVKDELDHTRKASEALRKEVDITTLSYGQLENHVKQLARDLKTLKPGTDEFVAASAKLQTAKTYLDQVTTSAKGVSTASKQAAKDLTEVANAGLTFGELKTKVEQLKTKLDTLSPASKEFITTARQLATTQKAYDDVKDAVNEATQALHKQLIEAKNSDLTYGQLETKVKLLNAELKKLKPGTEDFIKASKNLQQTEKDFEGVQKQVKGVQKESEELAAPSRWQKIASGVNLVSTAFKAFFALQIIGYIIDIGKAIFETTAKFEKYDKVLTTALGSEKLAKESMAALKELGSKTAFSVDELTEGYVKMVNRGLRPSQKEMVAMTDLAASQGKTFDQLVEAALDAATGEFERLKEFGIKAKKEGDNVTLSFKGMNQTVKNTPEAINGAITAFGLMNGVAGQNAKMMETLGGQTSNLGDNFDALKVELGEKLRPVFVLILQLFNSSIPVIRLVANVIFTVVSIITTYYQTLMDFAAGASGILKGMGTAAKEFLSGNFDAASKAWDQTKTYGSAVMTGLKNDVKAGAQAIKDIWIDPTAGQKAEFAGQDQGKKFQGGLTDEQKKAIKEREKEAEKARKKEEKDHEQHLEEVKKANEKALSELAKIEADTHIASIKDEEMREMTKIMVKRDQRADEIMRSLASEKLKDAQLKALNVELEADLTRVHADFTEKRRKASEEEEKRRLEVEKMIIAQQQQAENALFDWRELMARGNADKLATIHKERADKQLQLTKDRLDAEEAAELAKAARDATTTEQAEAAQTAIRNRYDLERKLATAKNADEILKIEKDLKEKKNAIWTEAGNAFSALLKGDLSGFVGHLDKMVQGEKEAWQKRLAENMAKYEAVAQMATAAVNFLNQLEQKKAEKAINEAKRERDEKVRLLNDQLATEKAAQDAAEAEKQRITQQSNDQIQALKSSSQQTIAVLEQQYRELSSSQEKQKLEQQLAGYKENADGKSAAAKDAAADAIESAQREAKESIAAAQQAEKETIRSATNEKDQKIDAAEAARDAEIAAINKRKDIDQATRAQLLAEAKTKFEAEKKMAQDEAQEKIDQAKKTAQNQQQQAEETAKLKAELAKDTQDAELKAIEAVQKGDEKAAKEILAKAREDQKEKIRLAKEEADKKIEEAEKEKREKLKKVEAEKQARVQNQKELNRSIEAENKKAADTERAAKEKAWKAQQKADIASAVIAGALAAVKALASGFFPVNIAFAAATAVATGVQIAMIKRQSPPSFDKGGFIPQGGRHGSTYGTGGLAIIERETGREQGEMEGGEAIISREQTQANLPLIRRMFANARTPGRRNQPVAPIDRDPVRRDPEPLGFRDGGLLAPRRWKQPMYVYGGVVGRTTPRRYEDGGFSESEGSSDGGSGINEAEARAASERAEAQGKEQLRLLTAIKDGVQLLGTNQATAFQALESGLKQTLSSTSMMDRLARMQATSTLTTAMGRLSDELVLAIAQTARQQNNDIDRLATGLALGLTQLETGLKTALTEQGNQTINALALSRLSQTLGLSSLGQNLMKAIDELEKQNARELALLRLTNSTGFASLRNQSKNDFDALEQVLRLTGEKTVQTIRLASLASQLTLTSLEKATVRSLDALSQDVTTALDALGVDVTGGLDQLSKVTQKSLTALGGQTEAALKASADRTTRSLDTLSVEVRGLKGSINAVEGAVHQARNATHGVEGAIWATNQAGRLEALIGAISTLGG